MLPIPPRPVECTRGFELASPPKRCAGPRERERDPEPDPERSDERGSDYPPAPPSENDAPSADADERNPSDTGDHASDVPLAKLYPPSRPGAMGTGTARGEAAGSVGGVLPPSEPVDTPRSPGRMRVTPPGPATA